MTNRLILADFADEATCVILNGITVYHDDTDEGAWNEYCTAPNVAKRISKALGVKIIKIRLKRADLPPDWNFDDIEAEAKKRAASKVS